MGPGAKPKSCSLSASSSSLNSAIFKPSTIKLLSILQKALDSLKTKCTILHGDIVEDIDFVIKQRDPNGSIIVRSDEIVDKVIPPFIVTIGLADAAVHIMTDPPPHLTVGRKCSPSYPCTGCPPVL
ncbi:hypothetical protein TNCV_1386681 [Trichonephila clavipes]|nr:hypothetical protein TNCV_1386681 [Trichonephila clavipes]